MTHAERTGWILAVLLSVTVLGHTILHGRAAERALVSRYAKTEFAQREAIGALRTALRETRETLLVSERMRHECHEGIGLAHLRQRFLLEHLGLSEFPEGCRASP